MSKMEAVLKGCSTVASSVEWHLKMAGWSVLHPCGWFNNCNTGFLSMDEMKWGEESYEPGHTAPTKLGCLKRCPTALHVYRKTIP